jgi:hypothetical protein
MSVRVLRIRFKQATFNEVKAAAEQTGQPISAYLRDLIECDVASRRLSESAAPQREDATDPRRPAAR